MISRRFFIAGTLALAGTAYAPAAFARDWDLLGERTVMLRNDHDVIPVTATRGGFRKIKLRVRENGIFVQRVVVTYANGRDDDLPVRAFIPKGGETRELDLRGDDRLMRAVRLEYRSQVNGKGRATVRVHGLR